ncbi:prepilin peptidase [Aliikangiella coralliicola]|uniref:Prepilin leader peptidase/N-methyltransferase n=2 Tax=Aliikangiella coralliicola TaxID=2592383 RepID=A0A545U0S8_9GAMM|nr:prepilin peptidase [Aliikangiella coralliicola]
MNQIIQTLEYYPAALTITTMVFGLLVGSFLNVVIYRYPVMLFREWESMAKDVLKDRGFTLSPPKEAVDKQPEKFNLVVPRSTCPKCDHKITALENIPVISYLFLKGACRNCSSKISLRYPFIELLTGITFALCSWHFGFSWSLLFALIITAYFISMSMIDIDHQILPDSMTIPLLWLALLTSTQSLYVPLGDAVIGAAAGYMVLWSIYWLFKLITGKEGMGYGDFKLLAVIGALVGWQKLGLVVVLSAGVGAVLGGIILLVQNKDSQTKIPFGPYLAVSGWITFLWGDMLMKQYLDLVGL